MAEVDAAGVNPNDSLTPDETERMQRSYLLRRYWKAATGFWRDTSARRAWLLKATLLTIRLDDDVNWDQTLSGGEKQRVAFARMLIHKPTIVVMDEATSALDPASQAMLMKLIAERLPDTTIVSVAHRPELEAFHERKLVMEAHPEGARLARDVYLAKRRRKRSWKWSRRGKAKQKARKAA